MSNRCEIATADVYGDVYVAVQDGPATGIYGPDGENLITFFADAGKDINELTLKLIVSAYRRGMQHGIFAGEALARMEIRKALGL